MGSWPETTSWRVGTKNVIDVTLTLAANCLIKLLEMWVVGYEITGIGMVLLIKDHM